MEIKMGKSRLNTVLHRNFPSETSMGLQVDFPYYWRKYFARLNFRLPQGIELVTLQTDAESFTAFVEAQMEFVVVVNYYVILYSVRSSVDHVLHRTIDTDRRKHLPLSIVIETAQWVR